MAKRSRPSRRKSRPVTAASKLSQQTSASQQSTASSDSWYHVVRILAENRFKYKVEWVGFDPSTGEPWTPSWVRKQDVTDELIESWKAWKLTKRKRGRSTTATPRKKQKTVHIAAPESDGEVDESQDKPPPDFAIQPSQYYPPRNLRLSPSIDPSPPLRAAGQRPNPSSPPTTQSSKAPSPAPPIDATQLQLACDRFVGVEIGLPQNFDRADYVLYRRDPDGAVRAVEPYKTPVRRNPLIDYDRVIPDSQGTDYSLLSSFRPQSQLQAASQPRPAPEEEYWVPPTPKPKEYVLNKDRFKPKPKKRKSNDYQPVSPTNLKLLGITIAGEEPESPPPSYEVSQKTNSEQQSNSQQQQPEQSPSEPQLEQAENRSPEALLPGPAEFDPLQEASQQPSQQITDSYPSFECAQRVYSPSPHPPIESQPPADTPASQPATDTQVSQPETDTQASPPQELPFSSVVDDIEDSGEESALPRVIDELDLEFDDVPRRPFEKAESEDIPSDHIKHYFETRVARNHRFHSEPPVSQEIESISSWEDEFTFKRLREAEKMSQALRERMLARSQRLQDQIARQRAGSLTSSASPEPKTPTGSRRPSVAPVSPILSSRQPSLQPPQSPLVQPPQTPLLQLSQSPEVAPSHVLDRPDVSISQASVASTFTSNYFDGLNLGTREYVIGLPLNTTRLGSGPVDQMSCYTNAVVQSHGPIDDYLVDPSGANEQLLGKVKSMLDMVNKITTHPLLEFKARHLNPEAELALAESDIVLSSKFAFLRDFLEATRQQFKSIAVCCGSEMYLDKVEMFLRGLKVDYARLDGKQTFPSISEDAEGMIKVFIVPSHYDSGVVANRCDLVIAMDTTFTPVGVQIKQIRADSMDPTKMSPVIRLMTLNTVEHATLHAHPKLSESERLNAITEAVKILRVEAGDVYPQYAALLGDVPKRLADWIKNKCEGDLDLPTVPELPLWEVGSLLGSQLQSQTQSQFPGHQATPSPARPSLPVVHEHAREEEEDDEEDVEGRKRQRSTSNSQEGTVEKKIKVEELQQVEEVKSEVASMRESVVAVQSTQTHQQTTNEVDDEDDVAMEIDHPDEEEADIEVVDVKYIRPPHAPGPIAYEDLDPQELLLQLRKKDEELLHWQESTSRLQSRFEAVQAKLTELHASLSAARDAEESAKVRRDHTLKDMETLRSQDSALRDELKESREVLKNGPPESATWETQRAHIAELEKQLAAASSKHLAASKESDFFREQYQNASSATLNIRREVEQLTAENEVLLRKADERVVQLHELKKRNEIEMRDKEIEKLSIQLRARDERLGRMEVERLQNSSRASRAWGTRSASVPRRGSPVQSRQSSPGIGLTPTPLRNLGWEGRPG